MADMTLDQIWQAANQLSRDQQEELIRRLQTGQRVPKEGLLEDIPLLNIGPWPEDWPPRREDLYDDEHRAGLC